MSTPTLPRMVHTFPVVTLPPLGMGRDISKAHRELQIDPCLLSRQEIEGWSKGGLDIGEAQSTTSGMKVPEGAGGELRTREGQRVKRDRFVCPVGASSQ